MAKGYGSRRLSEWLFHVAEVGARFRCAAHWCAVSRPRVHPRRAKRDVASPCLRPSRSRTHKHRERSSITHCNDGRIFDDSTAGAFSVVTSVMPIRTS